jgi:tetratricopeptide (TPR) repeat protein
MLRVASAACFAAAIALAAAPRARAELSEQSMPGQGLPSNEATPAAPIASPQPEDKADWEEVAPGAEVSPEPAAPAEEDGAVPSPSPSPGQANAPTQGADAQATPSGPPPALDISAISTGPDLASTSLEAEIGKADNPALAASLRYTEDARKQLGAGKIDDALRSLSRAISIDPGNAFAYFYLGRGNLMRKNYDQALIFFRRAESGFGSRPEWLGEAMSFEGACDEELGHADKAEKAYQQALAAAPNNLMARIGYGRLAAINGPIGNLDAPPPEQDLSAPDSGWEPAPAPLESPPPPASEQ